MGFSSVNKGLDAGLSGEKGGVLASRMEAYIPLKSMTHDDQGIKKTEILVSEPILVLQTVLQTICQTVCFSVIYFMFLQIPLLSFVPFKLSNRSLF